MSEENTRFIFLYRLSGNGKRQKYRFALDSRMNILSEDPCHEDGTLINTEQTSLEKEAQQKVAIAASPQLRRLDERGYKYHLQDGKLHLDSIPEIEIQIGKFFLENAECPFPGCEPLRARYLEELRALEGEDGECSSCDKGTLQGKYREVVHKHIISHAT